jgi:hypothetical protein
VEELAKRLLAWGGPALEQGDRQAEAIRLLREFAGRVEVCV